MLYVCAQPATAYYAWQLDTMLCNFLKNGVPPADTHVVLSEPVSQEYDVLEAKHPRVRLFRYHDTRTDRTYIPSVRPHLLRKHFEAHAALYANQAVFYHDCDIVFTRPVRFDALEADDTWYLSDTRSYIDHAYVASKGAGIYEGMCAIVGIDASVPKLNAADSGGAQYVMKRVTAAFWEKVERDCVALYAFMQGRQVGANPIQSWTADMWAVLYNAWLHGHRTEVTPALDFAWPNNGLAAWERCAIYHNAGVLASQRDTYFYKGDYIATPPTDVRVGHAGSCSHMYAGEVNAAMREHGDVTI